VNDEDKTCVRPNINDDWGNAISNNILRAGKHYVSFQYCTGDKLNLFLGVMRPGQANRNARNHPLHPKFYQNFSPTHDNNNSIKCCMHNPCTGLTLSSNWRMSEIPGDNVVYSVPVGSDGDIGMLLDLEEGSLSIYKDGRKLGVMKYGLAGPYCWVVSMLDRDSQVTIKRGTIPS